jgi:hypothetical protein
MSMRNGTRVAVIGFTASVFFGPLKPSWLLGFMAGAVIMDYVESRRIVHTFDLPGGGVLRVHGASKDRATATAQAFGAMRKRGEA